jgi:hypothetical protein
MKKNWVKPSEPVVHDPRYNIEIALQKEKVKKKRISIFVKPNDDGWN